MKLSSCVPITQACFFNIWLTTGANFFAQILSLTTNTLSLADNSLSLAKNYLFLIKKIIENLEFDEEYAWI